MTNRPRLSVSRGDIWLINFDPTIGDEIQKTRPAIVVSVRSAYRHQLQIVVPITSWQARFANDFWMVYIGADSLNGLDKDSAANAFQVKSVSEDRFVRKFGEVTAEQIDQITAAIALCIGYNPPTIP
jgi:mRNA interferase MazF